MHAIELTGVTVTYGSLTAVDRVSATITPGSITALIGNNGAGKSSLMRAILGIQSYTGSITIGSAPPRIGRPDVAYIPDVPLLPTHLTPAEYLVAMGGTDTGLAFLRASGLSEVTGRISTLSRGMTHRLAIAGALARMPEVVIADEPTGALDPQTRIDVMNMFRLASSRTTILWSTHVLSEAASTATHVLGLESGALIYDGPPSIAQADLWIVSSPNLGRLRKAVEAHPSLHVKSHEEHHLTISGPVPREIPVLAVQAGLEISELRQADVSLTDILGGRHA